LEPNRKVATIHDVAKAAGVSVSTVSRVLNNKDDVAQETHERVQKVIDDLGYTSSLAARGMRSRRTNVIGLIMPDVASPYCLEVLRGVNQAIANLDYDLIIYTNGDVQKYGTADQELRYVSLLNGRITDGIIVVTPVATNFSTNAPVVAIDPNTEEPECIGVIGTNRKGALMAMNYLTGLGHRRIGHITGRLDLVSGCRRLQGYREGLDAVGIPYEDDLVQISDYTTETAAVCTQKLLQLDDRPTAIFAANDMSALGVYQAAELVGLRIPDDLSVVGFDNLPVSSCMNPPMTTIDQTIIQMAVKATEMVIKLVNGESLDQNLQKISTQLIIRDSCSAVS